MKKSICGFFSDKRGSLATTIGVGAVPLMMAAGVAVDYTLMASMRSELQQAADAAALASAKELGVSSISDTAIKETALFYARSNLNQGGHVSQDPEDLKVKAEIGSDGRGITVEMEYFWKPMIVQYLDNTALPIRVSAAATLAGEENVCVVALDETSSKSLEMSGASTVHANGCSIFSNSSSSSGMSIVSSASMRSDNTYTTGGYSGPVSGYDPRPVTDSPSIGDPLIDRAAPSVGSCDFTNASFNKSASLDPGVYCGGISINGSATIDLKPGTYIIKDGPLSVSGNATIRGNYVGFYFTGTNATFDFGVSTQINLSAPKTGALSGMLFFEDRSSPANRDFVIRSKDAEKFEGTVYLPQGKLTVDKASRVGQLSDWTAIIARRIEVKKGPNLQINSDYGASDIPVPDGVGPQTGDPRLTN